MDNSATHPPPGGATNGVHAPESGRLTIKTIAGVREGKTYGMLTCEEFPRFNLLYGADAEFAAKLAVGACSQAVIEKKASPNGSDAYWLRSWDGVSERKARGSGGGGGNYAPKPRPEMEIIAEIVRDAYKASAAIHGKDLQQCSGVEISAHEVKVANTGNRLATAMVKQVKELKGKLA